MHTEYQRDTIETYSLHYFLVGLRDNQAVVVRLVELTTRMFNKKKLTCSEKHKKNTARFYAT
jgi:hypothetical protein